MFFSWNSFPNLPNLPLLTPNILTSWFANLQSAWHLSGCCFSKLLSSVVKFSSDSSSLKARVCAGVHIQFTHEPGLQCLPHLHKGLLASDRVLSSFLLMFFCSSSSSLLNASSLWHSELRRWAPILLLFYTLCSFTLPECNCLEEIIAAILDKSR